MKRASIYALLMAVLSIAAPLALKAQRQDVPSAADRFVISARAGGVSHVEGSVTVARTNGTAGLLLKRDQIDVGDKVETGTDGRAEVLLNPGSYLRLGSNSAFEFGATDLEDLTIKLNKGTAIFEVFAADEFRVSVFTPKGKVALVETGVYRVDVAADGTAAAFVTKGKAEIGESDAVVVKEGRTATVGQGAVAVTKFDKDKRDEFAQWSKDRSKALTKANEALQGRALDTALASGFRNGTWNLRQSFGLWIFDYMSGRYCFLPYGFNWRSPYGGWYGNGIPTYFVPVGPTRTRKIESGPGTVKVERGGFSGGGQPTRGRSVSTERKQESDPLPITRVGRGSGSSVFTKERSVDTTFDSFPTRGRSTGPDYVPSPPPTSFPPPAAPPKVARDN